MERNDKIALCVIGRLENRYAVEYVEYYRALGFDKIFIIDNNYEGEDHFEDVLGADIADGFVEVLDYRNCYNTQKKSYNECYQRYGGEYMWMAFLDFDEFLTIVDGGDIHDFMRRYEDADCVVVNYRIYTDNGLLYYDARPVTERFTEPMEACRPVTYGFPENDHVKSIVRCGLPDVAFTSNPHVPSNGSLCCVRADGTPCDRLPWQPYDHRIAYIRHYLTKTAEEWMTCKVRRGYPVSRRLNMQWRARHLQQFFTINERTPEKEALMLKLSERLSCP